MLAGFIDPDQTRASALGAVIPHAGYIYSGHVAGAVFSKLEIPIRNIILCPNHTGLGPPLSIMRSGRWLTPLGSVEIDEELSDALIVADPSLQDDEQAHRYEHAIEVMLPFIQRIAGSAARFVPITVGVGSWPHLQRLGLALAEVIRGIQPRPLVIASSDMNHYESDSVTRVKDGKAIDRILALDSRGLHDVVEREHISMCGYGPATAMLIAAKELGAATAELVRYATSADVSGDFDRVVGYAGMIVR